MHQGLAMWHVLILEGKGGRDGKLGDAVVLHLSSKLSPRQWNTRWVYCNGGKRSPSKRRGDHSGDMGGGQGGTSSQAILGGLPVPLLREKQPLSLSPSPAPEQVQVPPCPDMGECLDWKFQVTAALSQASFLAQLLHVPRWSQMSNLTSFLGTER